MEAHDLRIIMQRLERIDLKVSSLLKQANRETWLTAAALRKLTGWDANTLLMMRRNKVVREKKIGKKVRYLLQSVPEVLLKRDTH